ncbi:MAG TPA: hypothetical protein GXX34_05250 [Clostridia bacterium]|nr:hypothetical protein [Clostridia bacterium]
MLWTFHPVPSSTSPVAPATLAMDLGHWQKVGYSVIEAQPVGMFPQTHHAECVALMCLDTRECSAGEL